MPSVSRRSLCALLLAFAGAAVPAIAQDAPPTPADAQPAEQESPLSREFIATFQQFVQAYQTLGPGGGSTMEALTAFVEEWLPRFGVASLSVEELNSLPPMFYQVESSRQQIIERAEALAAEDPDSFGKELFVRILRIGQPRGPEELVPVYELIDWALTHPKLEEGVEDLSIASVVSMISQLPMPPEQLEQFKPGVARLLGMMDADTGAEMSPNVTAMWPMVLRMGFEKEELKSMRVGLLAALRAERERIGQRDPRAVEIFSEQIAYLSSDVAVASVLGSDAPEIEFTWSSREGLTKLSDLEGKVVVLDFWATWCVPCIVKFPELAKLQERYEGYDVVVLGVTHPQGTFTNADGSQVPTQGNPQREHELMPAFMEAKNITWPIVFSPNGEANFQYGVEGIPHVTIVGPDGTVVYNEDRSIYYADDYAKIIDKLLANAGKPVPGGDDDSTTETDTDTQSNTKTDTQN
ncbi:MAG: TlpA disulfide reductase family protein [Planctomycetota bacterium]